MAINNITVEDGYLVVTYETNRKERLPLHPVLDQVVDDAEMPDIPIASLTLVTKLARVVNTMLKRMVMFEMIDEAEIADGLDLEYLHDVLVDELSVDEW